MGRQQQQQHQQQQYQPDSCVCFGALSIFPLTNALGLLENAGLGRVDQTSVNQTPGRVQPAWSRASHDEIIAGEAVAAVLDDCRRCRCERLHRFSTQVCTNNSESLARA